MRERDHCNAVVFATGGYRPTKRFEESWIGRIGFRLPEEEIPRDSAGAAMFPIAMFALSGLQRLPEPLKGKSLLSVFLSPRFFDHLAEEDRYAGLFHVRTHTRADELTPCEWTSDFIKPFPLTPTLVRDDWDSGYYQHKIGGYPTFCQDEAGFDGFGFVFQIASDPKACLNIVDDGRLYFFHNHDTDTWKLHCDFY